MGVWAVWILGCRTDLHFSLLPTGEGVRYRMRGIGLRAGEGYRTIGE